MAPLVPGQRLADRFTLVAPAGGGPDAVVWRADDVVAGRPVALKLLSPDVLAARPSLAGSLEAEAARLRRLAHPGIVRAQAVGEAGGWEYLALEWLPGGSIAALRGAPWREVVRAALELAEALQFAHAIGIVHRDLKPANVLRDGTGRWRLVDFGAGSAPGESATARSPGSLSGMSPAQALGEPPTPADDLYGFGALLFDLLTGQPPFHPGITPERIRGEVPPRVAVDGAGEAVPGPLAQLVAALLEKSPLRRPAGMGAVRTILEELLAPPPVAAATPRPAPAGAAPAASGPAGRGRAVLVYASLAMLLLAAVAAVVLLPDLVRERGPLVTAPAELPSAPAAAPATDAPPADRDRADAARAAWLAEAGRAGEAGLERFRPGVIAGATAEAASGDTAYQARRFAAAAEAYARAEGAVREARESIPALLAAALRAGDDALAAGDATKAATAYGEALLIEPGNAAALRGRERAARLPEVLAAMTAAAASENSGDLAAARRGYGQALALDPEWEPARTAVARLEAGQATAAYQQAMAAGLAAAAAGRQAEATAAYNRALGIRPGDAAARAALADLQRVAVGEQLRSLAAEADRLAAAERWSAAADRYEELLRQDPNLAGARDGLATARARADLDRRLTAAIAGADRLNEEPRAAAAAAVLAEARAVSAPGATLAGQVAELARLLEVAAKPVPVPFESDNLTRVTILKVGDLGTFASRTVPLRPGAYTVVGSRVGYRDVRRQIRVGADGVAGPVVVRCEEPI
ncbi:MAG: serine/threonine protein kinase [Chromatiales bacterium]|nr:serine/threonine protein kinase [Chromatiales bacterium]